MSMITVKLKPGVDIERTPSLLEAGYAASQLMRFRSGLAEKIGGWVRYYAFAISGIPRALHAWRDLNDVDRLAVGTTTLLGYVENDAFSNITPQTLTSDLQPNFATTAASPNVTITDANTANLTDSDSVEFKTPVSVGGLILSGVYPIALALSSTSYRIVASSNATATRANATITGITAANPGEVTTSAAHGFSTGDLIYISGVVGMTQVNGLLFTITSTGANTFTIGVNTSAYTAYTSGGTASPAHVPFFGTTTSSATVNVTLAGHGRAVGDQVNFPLSTTVGGLTVSGTYTVTAAASANVFSIVASTQASSTTSAAMNSGQVEFVYYIAIGPLPASTGYGIGTYGSGGYGTGTVPASQTGTAITSTDWSLDNWGQVLLACSQNRPIYYWQPATGFQTARPITGNGAPAHNTGMFVSMQTQMVIAYGSTEDLDIGIEQDPLLVKWCNQGDFLDWQTSLTSQAGSRRLPTGSRIIGGLSVPNQELLFTDLDLWAMSYLGFPDVWGFLKIGSSCGLASKHAVARMGSGVYWMGQANFFMLAGGGVQIIPCSVWDEVFQDLDQDNLHKVVAAPNTKFNEIGWYFPSESGGAGENDTYVKYNLTEGTWDYGSLGRSAWTDQSVLGNPIGTTSTGIIFQHEQGYNADGAPIDYFMESGWFVLSEGQDIVFCDWILPDMIWGTRNGDQTAQVQLTLYSAMYAGDTPRTYGPYTVVQATKYVNTRLRGRLAKIRISGGDVDSFVRLGGIRLRIAQDGRR